MRTPWFVVVGVLAAAGRPAAFAPPALRRASPELAWSAGEQRPEGRPLQLNVGPGLQARPSAAANQETPLRLTLAEAVSRGLEASHKLAEAIARGEAASAAAGERHAATRPQVAALAGYMRTNHVEEFGVLAPNGQFRILYPDVPDNYRGRVDLQWPVYTGGRLDALERSARIEAAATADDLAAARADLKLEIARAFWVLVTAGETLRVVGESVGRIEAHLADVRNQLEAGLVAPNDVLSVEAQAARQRMAAIQARSARDIAEADVARLVGAPPGTAIEPAAALDVPSAASAPSAALLETARAARPERVALQKRVDAARERTVAAAAGTKPTIAIVGGADYARPNPRIFPREDSWKSSWDAGVNLSWPLFDGGRARSEAAGAGALARAAAARLAEFDAVLAVEVRQRLSEIDASRAAIDAADAGVRSAAEARRVVADRFRAGVATNTDVLNAHVALLQAELDRTQAIAAAHLADARLARAIGR